MSILPTEAGPNRDNKFEQDFALGVKESEYKNRAREEKTKGIIGELKKDFKRLRS